MAWSPHAKVPVAVVCDTGASLTLVFCGGVGDVKVGPTVVCRNPTRSGTTTGQDHSLPVRW
jgi:hypothetical protein